MMIDNMATYYKVLPSELLSKGTTVDFFFFEKSLMFRNKRATAGKKEHTQKELLEILKKVKHNG